MESINQHKNPTISSTQSSPASESSFEVVVVNNLGKWKTAKQMTSLTILLAIRYQWCSNGLTNARDLFVLANKEEERVCRGRHLFIGRKGVQGAAPGPVLSWTERVRIAYGAAKGLEFLHEKVQPSVFHRDVRSSNVLLFDDFQTKIADFNLNNQSSNTAARLHSTRVLGTFDYHAPESLFLTTKVDHQIAAPF